jgi:hypothetical protein
LFWGGVDSILEREVWSSIHPKGSRRFSCFGHLSGISFVFCGKSVIMRLNYKEITVGINAISEIFCGLPPFLDLKCQMRIRIQLILILLIWTLPASADMDTAWVRRYACSGEIGSQARAVAVDQMGNVYVTGSTYSPERHFDYTTIKYNPNGDTCWVRKYNGANNRVDDALALSVDDTGNVYVTGYSEGSGTDVDYATVKYDSSGAELWVRRYNGPPDGYDIAEALAVDSRGNVYVTGRSVGSFSPGRCDYATIKYYHNGDTAWVRRYSGLGNVSEAAAIWVDDSGNVYVTGASTATSYLDYDYATVKYDSLGTQLWVGRYNGTGDYQDFATAVVVDDSGNVYVTGQSWQAKGGEEFATVKYDSEGVEQWVRRYKGAGNGVNRACDMGLDSLGDVFVTGESYQSGYQTDYVTICYSPEGDSFWARTYDQGDSLRDRPYALWIKPDGNVYVTGTSGTVEYDADGNQVWVGEWGGLDIASDSFGNVYLVGSDLDDECDFITVKYSLSTSVNQEDCQSEQLADYVLLQNYPNPFNQNSMIEFHLPSSGLASLEIYDILGRRVRTLVSRNMPAGKCRVFWNGRSDSGNDVASGVYFYRLKVGNFTTTKKLVLLK